MSKPPLKRVYFDTNILFKWPHLPNHVSLIFGPAKWVGTELYIPSVVESELEAQYVRDLDEAYEGLNSATKRVNNISRKVIGVDIDGKRPSSNAIREAFRDYSKRLKDHWGISTIPLPPCDVSKFVQMAIDRVPPFEEVALTTKKTQVVGLQDAAILSSVIEHMKTAAPEDRCSFVSEDGIFHKPATRGCWEGAGIKLELFKTPRALFDDLFNHVWDHNKAEWKAEMEKVGESLNEQKAVLSEPLLQAVLAPSLRDAIRAKEIKGLEIIDFRYIQIELPSDLPPDTPNYNRPEGSTVQISARAATTIDAIVEPPGLFAFLLGGRPDPPPEPKLERTTLYTVFNVSLAGTVKNGEIGNFEIVGVELSS